MTEQGRARPVIRQKKLRATERRDAELIAFANKMAKSLERAQSSSDRRDAKFWRDLARHIETTDGAAIPLPRQELLNTATLEKLQRGLESVQMLQGVEVARLREGGVPWDRIGEATGLTREGARRRWSAEVARLVEAGKVPETQLYDPVVIEDPE